MIPKLAAVEPGFNRAATASVAALLVVAAFVAPAGAQPDEPQRNLPRERLSIGVHQIEVQVASKPAERQIGLMQRREMPAGEGMLFVFEEAGVQCFWMKNTLLPLTAAFIADDGTIVNLADMQPETTDSHCSNEPVRYVLEMNQGWFAAKRVKPGFRVSGARFDAAAAPKQRP